MNKRTRVIEFIPQMIDAGAETLVKNYVLQLSKKFDVCLLVTKGCSYIRSANVRTLINSGITIYSPYIVNDSNICSRIFRKLHKKFIPQKLLQKWESFYIRKTINRFNPDVIHIHLKIGDLINSADRLKGVKLLYSCYSLPERYFNENELKSELKAAQYLVANNGLRFIAMHDEMRRELNDMFCVDNTAVLRNVIDVRLYQNVPLSKEAIRDKLCIPKDAFVIGHVGRMFYIKNQLFLIDIFLELLKLNPNAFLLLVGKGEDKQKIIDKLEDNGISNNTLILSNIDNLNIVYKAMDVFVFPSLLEGLPNVCIEAQAAGLRCIISSAVTKDVCLSHRAIQMDIRISPEKWARAIMDESIQGIKGSDISEYDLQKVMCELEELYENYPS